jgi:hypothetical protein
MLWRISKIDDFKDDIRQLFQQNINHKHAENYLKNSLLEYTVFARMAFDPHLIYYSAGIERPQYNGSIRIMSRHTRDVTYDFGGYAADLNRGLETLDASTDMAMSLGYTDIWVSREESPKLLEYFGKHSKYNWNVNLEKLHHGQYQYVLRKA